MSKPLTEVGMSTDINLATALALGQAWAALSGRVAALAGETRRLERQLAALQARTLALRRRRLIVQFLLPHSAN